ncbi:MAG: hypothetical protein ACRDWW_01805, partial [Acidimicrobiales bacterium]
GSGGSAGGGGHSGADAASGDTTHCAGGREFSPAIDYYAPSCTPGTPGAPLPNNGGATAPGVGGNEVEVVNYVTNYGAVVNQILMSEGLYESPAEAQQFNLPVQNFINSHYVLWGRKIHIDTVASSCQAAPPDDQCLLPEIDRIAKSYHPYAMFWSTTVCSACFAEMAKDGMVGIGGAGFSDALSNGLAPYFYTEGESSTRIETAFAQWWCNQMSTKNDASRTVAFAGSGNPAQNLNGKPRVLGVISTNDPDNENTVTQVLVPALNRDCGDGGSIAAHHYFYAQNAATAAQQSQAGISAMDTPTNPATDVLCLCDPVAPAFTFGQEKKQNYFPENLLASDQLMGADVIGQSYESGLGCPPGPGGCEWDRGLGLSTISAQLPPGKDAGSQVYKLGGGSGAMPVQPILADTYWEAYNMLASLIENTGPDLTPARMQAAAPGMGMRGGGNTGVYEVGFAPGDWQWTQDARIVYFDKNATSPYNGKAGSYIQVAGTTRYNLGQYPVEGGGPNVPRNR